MSLFQRMVGGFVSALALGVFLVPMIQPAEAEGGPVQPIDGRKSSSDRVQPALPAPGRPLYAPPVVIDRGPSMSDRPFAKPFLDQGPSMADRPLAPIGGGTQVAPGAPTLVWCQGTWMNIATAQFRCPLQ